MSGNVQQTDLFGNIVKTKEKQIQKSSNYHYIREKVTSLSGGQSSAMIESLFPADHLVFALVRTENKDCLFPDKKIRQLVSDKIGTEFIGTLEDDIIIYTMLELEQHFGKKINWVTGLTYEGLLRKKFGWLPTLHRRYCTTYLKIEPIFNWWYNEFNANPVFMNIGYRFGEHRRISKMLDSATPQGLNTYKTTFGKNKRGQNKWELVEWRKPLFPLFSNGIDKSDVVNHWSGKGIPFAKYNNCVGCFHRSPALLKEMWETHTQKMQTFSDFEQLGKGRFKTNVTYEAIKNAEFSSHVFDEIEAEGCSSGYCGF